MVLAAVYLLVVLMSFACEYYNVVFSGVLQGILYGFPAVFYDYVFAARLLYSFNYRVDYIHRVFCPGIIRCYYGEVREPTRYLAHYGALCVISVAAAAKQCNYPAGGEALDRLEHIFQRIWGMGVVEEHRKLIFAGGQRLQPAAHAHHMLKAILN